MGSEFIANIESAKLINNCIVILYLCGFLMSYKNWRTQSSVFIFAAFQMANITFASNMFNEFVIQPKEIRVEVYYLDMLRDDLLTILAIIVTHFILRVKIHKTVSAAIFLLLLNSVLYLFMHIDIVILEHKSAPWVWWDDFYTYFINSNEVLVAFIIIVFSFSVRKKQSLKRCSNGI
jgi:hypothetical protein